MDTIKRKRGRQVKPELDTKVAIASALVEVLACSAIEAARLVTQAEPELLLRALLAVPIDVDQVLEAISRGAYVRSLQQLSSDEADARNTAARALPIPTSGVITAAMEQRRAGRIRVLLNTTTEHERNAHPRAPEIEREALAINQGQKNRRTRRADNAKLVEALRRALLNPAYAVDCAVADSTDKLEREFTQPNSDVDPVVAALEEPDDEPSEPWPLG